MGSGAAIAALTARSSGPARRHALCWVRCRRQTRSCLRPAQCRRPAQERRPDGQRRRHRRLDGAQHGDAQRALVAAPAADAQLPAADAQLPAASAAEASTTSVPTAWECAVVVQHSDGRALSTAPAAVAWQPGRARSETIQRERALLMGSGERDGGVQQERWRSPVRTPHRAGLQRCQLARSSRAVCAAKRSSLSALVWQAAAPSRPPSRSAAAAQHGRPPLVAGNSSGRCTGVARGRAELAALREEADAAGHAAAAAVRARWLARDRAKLVRANAAAGKAKRSALAEKCARMREAKRAKMDDLT
jgi:hypothetical protein